MANPFTLDSYERGLRKAWTRKGVEVTVYPRNGGLQLKGWPLAYRKNPYEHHETHITSKGTMFETNMETVLDIFETDPTKEIEQ